MRAQTRPNQGHNYNQKKKKKVEKKKKKKRKKPPPPPKKNKKNTTQIVFVIYDYPSMTKFIACQKHV